MMIKKSWILISVLFLLMAGCSSSTYKKITAQQGREMLQSDSSVILLDVRTVGENMEIRIPGSMLIPLDTLKAQAGTFLPDKNAKIIIYCRSGNRSKDAADILIGLGYMNIFDMGGIIDWPYETESE
ncbi:MAG: rhodanese-like domain-containing protein [Firmicutes bacterium HGW-Firmicutes-10]|jgi:rhodanese-related sulfurtransferase|nr:MAG: rhodanese-like domain-containing protein [Firmicutes bacterium HGW-Firmicutes-10]